MLRRSILVAIAGAPALTFFSGCSVEPTVSDGPDAPSFVAPGSTPPLALVLAAGGPRGFAHVGVLKALHELDIRPDVIVGASVGALLGGALAAGLSIPRIEALAYDFDFYKLARWSPSGGLQLDGALIAAMVRDSLGVTRFSELKIPFTVVATDMQDARPVAFNQGDLGVAIQASCAIPGRFAPVRIRGREVADADVSSPLPVRIARSLGARRVLAVDVAVHTDKPRPAGAERYVAGDRVKREQIDAEARLADLVLHPYFGYWVNLSREYRVSTAQAAYEQTLQQAEALKALFARA
jgi:NTE family protein